MKGISLYIIIIIIFLSGCTKDFLDKIPNDSYVVPNTIDELQAILDNVNNLNKNMPRLGEISTDDFYVDSTRWKTVTPAFIKNAYVWAADLYQGERINTITEQWSFPYRIVFYSNVAIDGIGNITKESSNKDSWNNVKGSALFLRAFGFFQVSQLFCQTYNKNSALTDLGIPLRLSPSIEDATKRATMQQTYDQIIGDLKESLLFLPDKPIVKTRPCKAAAYALLAKVYLIMQDYPKALEYADSCLAQNNTLMDYNNSAWINQNGSFPFKRFNDETIFYSLMQTGTFINSLRITDSLLYKSYDINDMRKKLFFSVAANLATFKGSYDGTNAFFCGLATDEIYFIRSECNARQGNVGPALSALNDLLIKRWKKGSFVQVTETRPEELLKIILVERRKQLLNRGVRWSDLRRLNKEANHAIIINRKIANQIYVLQPNDKKYTFPIPDAVIETNNIEQNSRE